MAQRKLQQDVDKCFKKVAEGVAEFESIYEKIEQSANPAQKEKLEDNLKREIKKLQRLRDQIKSWAAQNDIKDKGPLLENRKLIETQMEKFKAVEKAMKTKAFSKEGLSAATKLDPKERAKLETCDFLSSMVEELERQIETLEAEGETIQATMKKGKGQSSKADRIAEIERITEQHKWHQGKLELIKRSLENGRVDTEDVAKVTEDIKFYVQDHINGAEGAEYDEAIYDDLNLQEEEDVFGMNNENDRMSSQDAQSIQDDVPESDSRPGSLPGAKPKQGTATDPPVAIARRPSTQLKSPLPVLATLHTPLSNASNGSATVNMKPATLPVRAPGETLRYASAAAAAATNSIGLAPLPPPPGATPPLSTIAPLPPVPASVVAKTVAKESPTVPLSQPTTSQPTTSSQPPARKPSLPSASNVPDLPTTSIQSKSPALSQSSAVPSGTLSISGPNTPAVEKVDSVRPPVTRALSGRAIAVPESAESSTAGHSNGFANGVKDDSAPGEDESLYHLPSSLEDLWQSYDVNQKRASTVPSQSALRMLAVSQANLPTEADAEQPKDYRPKNRFNTPPYYPQEVMQTFDNPLLYSRLEPDTLFYAFYYQQGTYQQYLSAKALKDQSWRFHKQYSTWFQRHEEPKTITEDFEQGTYRFFDYESTWMNRRKADFKFAYKFLEDVV